VIILNLTSKLKEGNMKSKIVIVSIFAVVLLGVFLIYKIAFTNPAGVDNQFYKDYKYAYDTMMEAYDEDRELSVYEKSKIDLIIDEFEAYRDEHYQMDEDKVSDKEWDELVQKSEIFTPIAIMYNFYDATSSFEDRDTQMKFLDDFLEQEKQASIALGIS
jgi:hypothetical protein